MRREAGNQRSEVGSQRSETRVQKSEVGGQNLDSAIEESFSQAVAEHGDLGLALEQFAARLNSIITKRPRALCMEENAFNAIAQLHTDDLYLATACAHCNEPAWNRFATLYCNHIASVAHSVCSSHQQARELAGNMLGYLYLRDRAGHTRIATYDGSGSLRSWVATVTRNQAINANYIPAAELVPLDSLRNTQGAATTSEMEATALFKMKYARALADSCKRAADELTDRQRMVLALRFEEEMRVNEIARLLEVHPAQITRTLRQAEEDFRQSVLMHLATEHLLNEAGVKECLSAFVDRGIWPNFLVSRRAVQPDSIGHVA